eukprot:3527133-Prymnesium_polylepis.1
MVDLLEAVMYFIPDAPGFYVSPRSREISHCSAHLAVRVKHEHGDVITAEQVSDAARANVKNDDT